MCHDVTYTNPFVPSGNFATCFLFFASLFLPVPLTFYLFFLYISMAPLSAAGSSAVPEYISYSTWRLILEGDLVERSFKFNSQDY
jgi:hypothetical protein